MNMINDVVSIASKKKCSQCGMIKSLNEFSPNYTRQGGKRADCKSCHAQIKKVWDVWNKYGVKVVLYNERMESTGGRCQICGLVTTELAYDHCHEMGAVPESFRGVLCRLCNSGISWFDDNLEGIKKAYDYLLQWECKKMLLENQGKYGCGGTLFRL
jgi:hypothetical protein